jgi:pimeloyl-ACP methyl ester carboxylesterase
MAKNRFSDRAWKFGLGAGLVGALVVALKYAVRPSVPLRMPGEISPDFFATKVLHTSLGEVVFHEAGSGAPLVFIHDVCCGGSSYEWSKVYSQFVEHHRVVALDLVGFGESSRPARTFRSADYVRMLEEFLRAMEWESLPVMVASGLGAGFCLELAASQPELVSGLVVYRANGGRDPDQPESSLLTRLSFRWPLLGRFLYRNHLATRGAMAAWLRRQAFAAAGAVTDEHLEVFTDCARQPGAEYAVIQRLAGRLTVDVGDAALRCRKPVRVLEAGAPMAALENPEKMGELLKEALVEADVSGLPG